MHLKKGKRGKYKQHCETGGRKHEESRAVMRKKRCKTRRMKGKMATGVADICLKRQKPEMNPFNQTKSERGHKKEEERASKYRRGCGNDYEGNNRRKKGKGTWHNDEEINN